MSISADSLTTANKGTTVNSNLLPVIFVYSRSVRLNLPLVTVQCFSFTINQQIIFFSLIFYNAIRPSPCKRRLQAASSSLLSCPCCACGAYERIIVSAIDISLTDRSDGYLIRTGNSITEHGVLRV
jgi:hypothetical protein